MSEDRPIEDLSISSTPKTLLALGAIAAAVPFVLSVSSSSTVTENGRVIEAHYRDNVALIGGIVAMICAAIVIVVSRRYSLTRSKRIGAGAVVLVLGGFQIARGVGAFHAPASEPERITMSEPAPMSVPVDAAPSDTPEMCANEKACNELGRRLEKTDPAGSRAAYLRGCGPEGRGNCFNAALSLRDGLGGPHDVPEAAKLFDQACGYGMATSCSNLGALLVDGDGIPKDLTRATALFEQACNEDDALGCHNLAYRYQDGSGVQADAAKARELFTKACDHGWASSCDVLGVRYATGDGVRKNPKRARELFEKACNAEEQPQCYNLGVLYAEGLSVKRDDARARELYEKACNADSRLACNNLGSFYEHGRAGPKDLARAREFYSKACDQKLELGCKNRDRVDGPGKH